MSKNQADDVEEKRWLCLVVKDKTVDGQFFYAIVTTGVYCRSSCSSKMPNRENVQFFTTREEAERAGYRACKRCKPDGDAPLKLHESKIVDHRLFKKIVGVTPKQYQMNLRSNRFQKGLTKESAIESFSEGINKRSINYRGHL